MKPANKKLVDRNPVASGRFYSAHADKLEIEIANMISEASELTTVTYNGNDILGIIAPHAGYVFSGIVAASAFMHLKDVPVRKKVFLLGSSHHTDFNGASIYNIGHYLTPFGKVKVDLELANQLIDNSELFNFVHSAHTHEHSIEVMLPFIQYLWNNDFEIIPIIIATHQKETCQKIAQELQPHFNAENLFVISTDLSHYPEYNDAINIDKLTIEATATGKPDILYEQIQLNKHKNISNLATSMCGWTSVITSMYMAENKIGTKYLSLLYQNSGDAKLYGDNDRVVGYQSMLITIPIKIEEQFQLSDNEKQKLISTARESIEYYQSHKEHLTPSLKDLTENLKCPGGAFVSIYSGNELRGCIGRMHSTKTPLIHIISDVAVSAAFHDSRFEPLSLEEIQHSTIEISVLTPLKKINSINEFILGKHGIYIKKDFRTGTFLPQVADNKDWSKEDFLGHCARNKVGIGWDGWLDAELYTYEAVIFKD